MKPVLFGALIIAAAIPMSASAQDTTRRAQDSVPRTNMGQRVLVDETFTIPVGEFTRVFLAAGTVYRAEIEGKNMTLQVRPVMSGTQAPLVENLLGGSSASSTSLYTVRPRADAEYEFRTVGGEGGRVVTLRVTAQPPKVKKP